MKCQKCERPATFHITELTGGKPQELHLCEEHARTISPSRSRTAGSGAGSMAAVAGAAVHQWPWGRRPRSWPGSTSRPARFAASRSSNSATRAAWAARTTMSASRRSWSR